MHRGEAEAYKSFGDAVEALPMPVHLLIANHDDRKLFREHFPYVPSDEHGFIQRMVRRVEGCFVFLDTNKPATSCGEYCDARRAWLGKCLEDCRGAPVYLFMQHPPFDIGIPALDRIGLRDQAKFAGVIQSYDNIRHLFFGHVHRPITGSWRGISFSALYATNHQCALDLSAADELRYKHEDPSYAVVLLESDRLVVHPRNYLNTEVVATKPF